MLCCQFVRSKHIYVEREVSPHLAGLGDVPIDPVMEGTRRDSTNRRGAIPIRAVKTLQLIRTDSSVLWSPGGRVESLVRMM